MADAQFLELLLDINKLIFPIKLLWLQLPWCMPCVTLHAACGTRQGVAVPVETLGRQGYSWRALSRCSQARMQYNGHRKVNNTSYTPHGGKPAAS